ncbi:26S proteasome regulatory subunit 8, partial [Coemansia sp. RSA 560]
MSSSAVARGVPPTRIEDMQVADDSDAQGLKEYYLHKIQSAEQKIVDKTQNLRRLEAQRNALNAKVRLLKDELNLLQEPGMSVAEVVKIIGKKKVLVKQQPEGKYVVDIADDIDISKLTPSTRVALQ